MNRIDSAQAGRTGGTDSAVLRVFLAHAPAEQPFAATLTAYLRQCGAAVEGDAADALASALPPLVRAGAFPDWLLLLLSPDALWAPLVVEEMRVARLLLSRQRMHGVLAVVAAPCQLADIPPDWPITQVFDATRDADAAMQQLAEALGIAHASRQPARAPAQATQAAQAAQSDLAHQATMQIPAQPVAYADLSSEETALLPAAADPSSQETARLPTPNDPASEETTRLPAYRVAAGVSASHGAAVAPDMSAPPLPTGLGAPPRRPLLSRRALLGAGAIVAASALAGGGVYVWRSRQQAPPPPGPTVRWRYFINSRVVTAPVEAGNALYLGALDGHFYALSTTSHSARWRYNAHAAIGLATPVVASDGVYICADDNSVSKLSADPTIPTSPQRLKWRFRVAGKQFPTPALAGGILYATAGFNGLYALDAASGALRWRTRPTFNPTSPPTLDGGRIYLAAAGSAYALDLNGGGEVWQAPVGGAVYSRMPVVNGVVYVSSLADAVYALDAATGKQRWRYATTAQVYSMPVVDAYLGAVYIGGSDDYLYALDAATGALRWSQKLDSPLTTPKLVRGRLYVVSSAGYLYALNPANGAIFWQYVAGTGVVSPLGAGADTLYVGSSDGYLYALSVP